MQPHKTASFTEHGLKLSLSASCEIKLVKNKNNKQMSEPSQVFNGNHLYYSC